MLGSPCSPCCRGLPGAVALSGFGGFLSNWNYSALFGFYARPSSAFAEPFTEGDVSFDTTIFNERSSAPTIRNPGNGVPFYFNDTKISTNSSVQCRFSGSAIETRVVISHQIRAYPDNWFGVAVGFPAFFNSGTTTITYRSEAAAAFFNNPQAGNSFEFGPSDIVSFSSTNTSAKPIFAEARSRREVAPYQPTQQDSGRLTFRFFSQPPALAAGEYEIRHSVPSTTSYFSNVPIQFKVPTAGVLRFTIQGIPVNVFANETYLETYTDSGPSIPRTKEVRYRIGRWAYATLQENNRLDMSFPDLSFVYQSLAGGVDRGPSFSGFWGDERDAERVLARQGYFEPLPFSRGMTRAAESTLRKL